jgi:hypothetical protein
MIWIDNIINSLRLTSTHRELYEASFHSHTLIPSTTTGTTVYTAPEGKVFAVTDILISCNDDNDVTVYNGSVDNVIMKSYFHAQGQTSANIGHTYSTPYYSHSTGQSIHISTTTNNDVYVTITGYLI